MSPFFLFFFFADAKFMCTTLVVVVCSIFVQVFNILCCSFVKFMCTMLVLVVHSIFCTGI